jgi:hypothetical protein
MSRSRTSLTFLPDYQSQGSSKGCIDSTVQYKVECKVSCLHNIGHDDANLKAKVGVRLNDIRVELQDLGR